MMRRPTSVDPVNETTRTAGCASSTAESSRARPCTSAATSWGIPASWRQSNSSTTDSGAFSDARLTTVHPAASAGATFRAWIETGKFQGVRHTATPQARVVVIVAPGAHFLSHDLARGPPGLLCKPSQVLGGEAHLPYSLRQALAALAGKQQPDVGGTHGNQARSLQQ